MLREVSMTDGSSPTHLNKDKQADLVRGALLSGGDRQWLQRVSAVSAATFRTEGDDPEIPGRSQSCNRASA
jgi:hypothetical protein